MGRYLLQLLRPSRVIGTLVLLAAVAAALLWIIPSNHYLLLPDPAHAVEPLVRVQGEKPDRDGGGIYFVDVIQRRATLLERLFPGIRDGSTLVPRRDISIPGVSDAERRRADLAAMRRSQSVAAAVALRQLGYKVVANPVGALVTTIFANSPAIGKLKPGDVIVTVDARPVRTPGDLRRLMSARRPGDVVRLDVRNERKQRRVEVETAADPDDPRRAVIGIFVEQQADIKLPVEVRIDAGGVGGPSAGLAFALDLMEELGRRVDHGYRVAATGAIELDGSVSPIGGVRQKIYGARKGDVDIFLVPAGENADEARRHNGDVRVIPVQSFPQALHALATLPPKS